MVGLRRCFVSVGMVIGGRRAPWCRQPVGCHSRSDPCMPGWFGVGQLTCGLYIVGSFSLHQFGWCLVVSAALRSACTSWGLSCCSLRRRSRMLSLLFSPLVLRFIAACLSDVAVIVLRLGRAQRVVLVRRCCSRQWSTCLGLCGGPYKPGRPLRFLIPVFGVSACAVVALLPALCLAGFLGWLSPSPPNGLPVLLLDVLGCGGCLGYVLVVQAASGRHGML